jgi:hypothetical protein
VQFAVGFKVQRKTLLTAHSTRIEVPAWSLCSSVLIRVVPQLPDVGWCASCGGFVSEAAIPSSASATKFAYLERSPTAGALACAVSAQTSKSQKRCSMM